MPPYVRSVRALVVGRAALAIALLPALGALGACAGRTVEVTTGAGAPSETSLVVTNNLDQAVNIYVRPTGGSEIFLRQVLARATETVPVRGIAPGTAVALRAAPVDGKQSYGRENVTLERSVAWRVP